MKPLENTQLLCRVAAVPAFHRQRPKNGGQKKEDCRRDQRVTQHGLLEAPADQRGRMGEGVEAIRQPCGLRKGGKVAVKGRDHNNHHIQHIDCRRRDIGIAEKPTQHHRGSREKQNCQRQRSKQQEYVDASV